MASETFIFNLGDKVKDRISGLTGIVTSRAEHLYGCARYWVSPQEVKDGKPAEGAWFDEAGIELVEASVIKPMQARMFTIAETQPAQRRTGGPTNQPAASTGSTSR